MKTGAAPRQVRECPLLLGDDMGAVVIPSSLPVLPRRTVQNISISPEVHVQ